MGLILSLEEFEFCLVHSLVPLIFGVDVEDEGGEELVLVDFADDGECLEEFFLG